MSYWLRLCLCAYRRSGTHTVHWDLALRNVEVPLTSAGVVLLDWFARADPTYDWASGACGASGSGGWGGTAEPGCRAPSAGQTVHEGDLSESETWTADGSPHIVSFPVRLRAGVSLTIEPCAEVLLEEDTGISAMDE